MTNPDVTVIIAAYNVEAYVKRAIMSALEQRGVGVEVIVVDDCSTDGTVSAAQSIHDPRLTILHMSQNSGPGAARNAAIEIAKGKWISMLDADDSFVPDRLVKMLKCAERADAEIIVDNITVVNETDHRSVPMFPESWFNELETIDLIRLIQSSILRNQEYSLHCLKPLFLTGLVHQTDTVYDPAVRVGEDYLFFADLLAYGARCRVVPFSGYLYNGNPDSAPVRIAPEVWENLIQSEYLFLERHTFLPDVMREVWKRVVFLQEMKACECMMRAIEARNYQKIFRQILGHPWAARHFLLSAFWKWRKGPVKSEVRTT